MSNVSTSVATRRRNSGVVKINGHDSGWVTTPHVANVEQQITMTFPLTLSPVTDWPATVGAGQDSDIYLTGTNKFLENPVDLQTHLWRVILSFSRLSDAASEQIAYIIRNPISGFQVVGNMVALKGQLSGELSVILATIADSASIGIGYEMFLVTTQDMDLTIGSITRISNRKDNP